jgi:Ca2+-binding RTX toxin-like protein
MSDISGNNTYFGDAGNDMISGGGGHEQITGGTGDDSLTGGGGNDNFIFVTGDGADVITDFNISGDLIRFNGTGLSFADLTITDTGGGALVSYSASDSILLEGNLAADLGAEDFLFT